MQPDHANVPARFVFEGDAQESDVEPGAATFLDNSWFVIDRRIQSKNK